MSMSLSQGLPDLKDKGKYLSPLDSERRRIINNEKQIHEDRNPEGMIEPPEDGASNQGGSIAPKM